MFKLHVIILPSHEGKREFFFLFNYFLYKRDRNVAANHGPLITCIYNLNSYLISLIFKLILCNYDACYLNFMNFLHWYVISLKSIFMHKLGIILCLIDD